MTFGKIRSPLTPRHTQTACYTASKWRKTDGVTMTVPQDVVPMAREYPSASDSLQSRSPRRSGSAAARLRGVLGRPPVRVRLDDLLEAEGGGD